MRVHYLQHVPFEGPGYLARYFNTHGHPFTGTHLYKRQKCPQIADFDWLVILGGPMNINEEDKYPWLKAEKNCIRSAIDNGKKVLGICLGAQLLADVLGTRVYSNPYREIGWFPVSLTHEAVKIPLFQNLPQRFDAFHWHSETFDIPSGAKHLFTSEACKNQGFLYGKNVLGLQFHLETIPESARLLIEYGREEMDGTRFVQEEQEILASGNRFLVLNRLLESLLDSAMNM
ncbi:MAG: type 1 glutamine amidotransferase [Chlorobi bacterium]|nr:type 1 glutamine amidotransferase [Chlorobiota bacterium]